MSKIWKSRAVAAFVLMAVSAAVWAGGDAEAEKWLEKLVGLYEKSPYSADLAVEMSVPMGGDMKMENSVSGVHYYSDAKHQRMDLKMDMNMPGQGQMNMGMLLVFDGSMLWMKTSGAQVGGEMYMKMGLDAMEKMVEAGGQQAQQMANLSNMSPARMLENMKKYMEFTVKDASGDKVILEASMTAEAVESMGMNSLPGVSPENMSLTISMDKNDVLPLETTVFMNGGQIMKTTYSNYKKLSQDDVEKQGLFSFTPPEDAFVIDMEQMMQQQQQ